MAKPSDKLIVCAYLAAATAPLAAMALGVRDHEINGALEPTPRPDLTLDAVRTESFQGPFAAWFESHLGLRGYSIFVDNTILFHALRDTKPYSYVKLGLHNVLFLYEDLSYYNLYNNFYDPQHLAAYADKIAALQHEMSKQGRAFVPVIIPSKTTVYRDEIPAKWARDLGKPRPSDVELYGAMKHALEERHIAFVDARALLTTSTEPRDVLWAPTARHWSDYSGCLAMQQVAIRYRELTGKPLDYDCELVRARGRPGDSDYDLMRLANTWYVPHEHWVAKAHHTPPPPGDRPSLICIGTSFCWGLVLDAADSNRFSAVRIDYYNRTLTSMPGFESSDVHPHSEQWRAVFLTQDVYVFDLLETYLTNGNTFLEDAVDELSAEMVP
jgi:hypothetical protein